MIGFLQQARFLWWILAAVVVLRWFHLFSYRSDDHDLEGRQPEESGVAAAQSKVPPGRRALDLLMTGRM